MKTSLNHLSPALSTRTRRQFALWTSLLLLAASGPAGLADSTDITELLTPTRQFVCAGFSVGVLADVDGNGTKETFVVFNTRTGEAFSDSNGPLFGYGSYHYFFSGIRIHCGGGPDVTAECRVWFVDALAAGFNANNPATWNYKSVSGVQLVTHSDACLVGGLSSGYRQVRAYTERLGAGTVVGSFAHNHTDSSTAIQTCDFSSAQGIKEIHVRSDFCENDFRYFIIRSGGPVAGTDIGLRVHDGRAVVRIAAEAPGAGGALASPLRIARNGTTYGILLVDPAAANASRMRVNTSAGLKAWAKLP